MIDPDNSCFEGVKIRIRASFVCSQVQRNSGEEHRVLIMVVINGSSLIWDYFVCTHACPVSVVWVWHSKSRFALIIIFT